MSVLSLIQSHCRNNNLAVPTGVVGSTDSGAQQLLGLLTQVADEMVNESKFNVTTAESVFIATAGEDQGPLSTLAPQGYQFAYFETFYDRTQGRPLYGPLDETQWQQIKALPDPGPFYKFRIRGDRLLLHPAPVAPLSQLAFEYASSWCVRSATGVLQDTILADSDTFLFPERVLLRGLGYYWKSQKGLPYQEDKIQYYNLLNNYIARDKVKTRVNVSEAGQADLRPGIFIPFGNWGVS